MVLIATIPDPRAIGAIPLCLGPEPRGRARALPAGNESQQHRRADGRKHAGDEHR
jgi:hypothetical protein